MPPLYDYRCEKCEKVSEAYRAVAQRNDCPACKCGGATQKIISAASAISDLTEYYDDNLETHIRSRQHRKEVMREKKVYEKYGKGWH